MSELRPLTRVVALGRDTDLWLTVTTLSRALRPAGVHVVACELPTQLTPSHVSATLPALEALHTKLGIAESSLLRLSGGSFSLGQNFVSPPSGFFHSWGTHGAPLNEESFFPCWLRATRLGLHPPPLQNFCLTAVAAKNGRMMIPDDATVAFGRTDYGYHLRTWPYVGYLKSLAATLGVECHEAQKVSVERTPDGSIAAVLVDGSFRIEGELFVDASGRESILLGQSLQVPGESWRGNFNVDRILTACAPVFTSTPPFAEIRASRAGWTMLHPTRVSTGIVHAYCSDLLSDAAAMECAAAAAGSKLTDASCRAVSPHVRATIWDKNCVAVGSAACDLDPIHDVGMHVLQLGIVHLLSLFPVGTTFSSERAEYNRRMRSHYERIRDFQCAYYAMAAYDGEFWRRARDVRIPHELAHKIATFRACGSVPPMEDETFSAESWQAVLVGLGVMPESGPPAIDRIPLSRLREDFGRMLQFIQGKVLDQPSHDSYLRGLLV